MALDPRGVYSDAAVLAALRGTTGVRRLTYRYDRLSSSNAYLGPLSSVFRGSVSNNSLADIKRTARFSVLDDSTINYGSDRIKPYARLGMDNGGFVEWPLGVFLLATPSRALVSANYVSREVEAYDQLLILAQDGLSDRLSYAAGTLYTAALSAIGASRGFALNVTPSPLVMPAATEWEPGVSYLRVVNDLLAAINYESALFDENGVFVCRPYVAPSVRGSVYTYASDAVSVLSGDVGQTIDYFSVPNRWTIVKSEADQGVLISTYTNTSPTSPTSTVNRGRIITDFRTEQDAANQSTLDAKAARLAFEASQIFEKVVFSTMAMPFHGTADVLTLQLSELTIASKYSEQSWELELTAGAAMKHSVRRVVSV